MTSLIWRGLIAVLMLAAPVAQAQDRRIELASAKALTDTGFWSYVLPRFSLKTGISITLTSAAAGELAGLARGGGADIVVMTDTADADLLAKNGAAAELRGIMSRGSDGMGEQYVAVLVSPDKRPAESRKFAVRFLDWLVSDVGQRTINGFRQDGAQVFFASTSEKQVTEKAPPVGKVRVGAKLALRHCGRCHVIGEQNKYGGIDSTPSFPALRTLADWKDKFGAFWTKNPHPSFLRIKGLTETFDPTRGPAIHPIHLTMQDVENIGAFLLSIEPKDLGAVIKSK